MIRRFVFVRLDETHSTAAGRAETVAHTRQALSAVPGVQALEVGVAADEHALAGWDMSITLVFDDLQAFEAYRVHPLHRAYVDEYLAPRLAVIKAWNFTA